MLGAISFSVGAPGPKGTPTAVTTTPRIATTLDGRRSGPLTTDSHLPPWCELGRGRGAIRTVRHRSPGA